MQEPVELSFHGKSLSVLDLRRIAKAKHQGFDKPVTAYLGSAFMNGRSAAGIIFGHQGEDPFGRLEDGCLFQASGLVSVKKEGLFWVASTEDCRYVIASFKRGDGRRSLRDFLSRYGESI